MTNRTKLRTQMTNKTQMRNKKLFTQMKNTHPRHSRLSTFCKNLHFLFPRQGCVSFNYKWNKNNEPFLHNSTKQCQSEQFDNVWSERLLNIKINTFVHMLLFFYFKCVMQNWFWFPIGKSAKGFPTKRKMTFGIK